MHLSLIFYLSCTYHWYSIYHAPINDFLPIIELLSIFVISLLILVDFTGRYRTQDSIEGVVLLAVSASEASGHEVGGRQGGRAFHLPNPCRTSSQVRSLDWGHSFLYCFVYWSWWFDVDRYYGVVFLSQLMLLKREAEVWCSSEQHNVTNYSSSSSFAIVPLGHPTPGRHLLQRVQDVCRRAQGRGRERLHALGHSLRYACSQWIPALHTQLYSHAQAHTHTFISWF